MGRIIWMTNWCVKRWRGERKAMVAKGDAGKY